MTTPVKNVLFALCSAAASLIAGTATAAEAGLRMQTLAAAGDAQAAIPIAVYYPTLGVWAAEIC